MSGQLKTDPFTKGSVPNKKFIKIFPPTYCTNPKIDIK